MIQKTILMLMIFLSSIVITNAQNKSSLFDPDIYYDIYFGSQGQSIFVMKRIKILDENLEGNDPYIKIKTDQMNIKANPGYVFIKNIYTVVPSDSVQIQSIDPIIRK